MLKKSLLPVTAFAAALGLAVGLGHSGEPTLPQSVNPDQILADFVDANLEAIAKVATEELPNNAQPAIFLFRSIRCMALRGQYGGVKFPGAEEYEGVVGTCLVEGDLGAPSTESIFVVTLGAPVVNDSPALEGHDVAVESIVLLDLEEL